MTVFGYNHKLRVLLDTIVDMIVNFEVRADRFAVIKVMHCLSLAFNSSCWY